MARPIPMPTPIHAIMAAFNTHSYTAADLDPDNFHAPPHPTPLRLSVTEPTPPTTPSCILQPIAAFPALLSLSYYTPSLCMCMMMSALASTASGLFLVGNPHITSGNTIALPVYGWPATLQEPDWSLINQPPVAGSLSKAELKALNAKLTLALKQSHAYILA